MDLARCEHCAHEYDLELVPPDRACVLPECEGVIVDVRVLPYAAFAGVALGAAAVLCAFSAMATYNELAKLGDWRVLAGVAAALGVVALLLGRGEGPWALRAKALGFLGLVCAYPPFVILGMLLVLLAVFLFVFSSAQGPSPTDALKRYRDNL